MDNEALAELLGADCAGLHSQHAASASTFNFMLQLVIVIETIPWLAAGALIHDGGLTVSQMCQSPMFIIALVVSGVLGMVGYRILVYNRLLTNFYARCLNQYRNLVVAHGISLGDIPYDPKSPSNREKDGIMPLLHVTFTTINALYLLIGSYEVVKFIVRALAYALNMPAKGWGVYVVSAAISILVIFLYVRGLERWRQRVTE